MRLCMDFSGFAGYVTARRRLHDVGDIAWFKLSIVSFRLSLVCSQQLVMRRQSHLRFRNIRARECGGSTQFPTRSQTGLV